MHSVQLPVPHTERLHTLCNSQYHACTHRLPHFVQLLWKYYTHRDFHSLCSSQYLYACIETSTFCANSSTIHTQKLAYTLCLKSQCHIHTHTHTHTHTDRETERQRQRQRDRHTHRERLVYNCHNTFPNSGFTLPLHKTPLLPLSGRVAVTLSHFRS